MQRQMLHHNRREIHKAAGLGMPRMQLGWGRHLMRLVLLLVASIPPSIFVSTLGPRSLVDSIKKNAPRNSGLEGVKSFLANFCPVRGAHSTLLMLHYRKFPYQKIYERIEESPERQAQLFENLFNTTNENGCHETFFSPRKLQRNHILATKIFLGVESVVYKGRFFAPGLWFEFNNLYKKSEELVMAILRLCIMEQMGMVNDLVWLDRFLKAAKEDHVHEIFKLLFDQHEMTPEILEAFMNHWVGREQKSLVSHYLYPDLALSRGELLMRCALLSSVRQPEMYAECKGLEPGNNLEELQEIALFRKDRQFISILFCYKFQYQQDDLKISEMLEYVRLGGLSPLTTGDFIRSAFDMKAELGDWPLEHLQCQLPRTSLQVPKEDRLSAWLCSDALMYDEVITSLDDLYDQCPRMLINMRLTESVKMKDDRVVTRAAEYFILKAQAILDDYPSDQKAQKKILSKDRRKIMTGILYALAEGQYLDFSNTVLEMREGKKKWGWFKHVAEHDNWAHGAERVMRYLNSDEIYGYVHRVSSRKSVQDGRVAKVNGGGDYRAF